MRILSASILLIPYLFSLSLGPDIQGNSSEKSFVQADSTASDTLVKMERTVCFGTCPSYELTIQKNGKITFVGKKFVEHKGRAEGMISDNNLGLLIDAIKISSFMEMPPNPECESQFTDMPSVFLTIALDGERNSVTHYHGCKGFEYEDELYRLETTIDSLAGAQKWIGEE